MSAARIGSHVNPHEGSAAPAWPAEVGQWHADAQWQAIDLLSDVHLHASQPGTYAAWREHMLNTPADAVLILGDLFEVWIGDDARHLGFAAECAAVLKQAAERRPVGFMAGNRDFLVGSEMLADCGVQPLIDPTIATAFGRRWLLSHGDALCIDDLDYQRFRAQVRSADWQRNFLALPLAERQHQARLMRGASIEHQAAMPPSDWGDVDNDAAAAWLQAAGVDTLIHGHTHRPGQHALGQDMTRYVMGDWHLETAPGHGPRRAVLARLTAAGLQLIDLANLADSADRSDAPRR